MTFYRAKYESASKVYVKGARVRAITFSLRTQTKQNAQGDTVEFSGKFTSTEAVKRRACHWRNGRAYDCLPRRVGINRHGGHIQLLYQHRGGGRCDD